MDGLAINGEVQAWSTIYEVLRLSLKGERSWHCQAANVLRYLRGVCGRGVVCYYWQGAVSSLREVSAIDGVGRVASGLIADRTCILHRGKLKSECYEVIVGVSPIDYSSESRLFHLFTSTLHTNIHPKHSLTHVISLSLLPPHCPRSIPASSQHSQPSKSYAHQSPRWR